MSVELRSALQLWTTQMF